MDYYKKKIVRNLILALLFIIGVGLQFVGHSIESITGLVIQITSLAIILTVLFIYNRRYK
ncbi:MAG: hypothetical protein Q4B23_00285 [Helcococcus sp.]|nr:hypothetical protein [Helcococcus sp.]